MPRPLNDRIGFTVSTLTTTGTPSRALSPSLTYCGEWVNAGSMDAAAVRIASGVGSGISKKSGRRPAGSLTDAGQHRFEVRRERRANGVVM